MKTTNKSHICDESWCRKRTTVTFKNNEKEKQIKCHHCGKIQIVKPKK